MIDSGRFERLAVPTLIGLVVVAVLIAVASNAMLPYVLAVQAIAAVIAVARSRDGMTWPKVYVLAVCALCVLSLISWLVIARATSASEQVLRIWVGVAACTTLGSLITSHSRARVVTLALILVGAALSAALPVLVEIPPHNKIAVIPPVVYDMFNPWVKDAANTNVLAGTIALVVPLSMVAGGDGQRRSMRVLRQVALVVMVGALLILQSRGALMGTVVAAGAVVLMQRERLRRHRSGVVVIALLAAGIVVASLLLSLVLSGASGASVVSQDLADRQRIWHCGWNLFQDFAFTGLGIGSFHTVCTSFYPGALAGSDAPHAHALLLQIGLDLGVPGLVAWLAVLLVVFTACLTVWRKGHPEVRALAVGVFASQLVLIVHGAIDAVLWGMVRPAPLVWLLWGLAIGLGAAATSAPFVASGARAEPT